MKIGLILSAFLNFVIFGYGQHDFTKKSIPIQEASFYHPFLDNKLVSGQWIGNVFTPEGLQMQLTNGSGIFTLRDPQSDEVVLKFKGNTTNGIWDGYVYYFEKSSQGSFYIEGDFKSGMPNGKVICKLNDDSYIAGTFLEGKSFEKISVRKKNEATSTYCNGFDFMKYLKEDTAQLEKCKREVPLDDALYGAAIIMSHIASVSDQHTSIDKFMECMRLNEMEHFVKNPEYAEIAGKAIKGLMIRENWKRISLEDIQEQLKQTFIQKHYEHLASSEGYISFIGCLIEESR
jgi:hypothetical protein